MDSTIAVRLKKVLSIASLLFGAAAASAEETAYSVIAIEDAAHSQLILDENYEAAIDELVQIEAEGLDAFYASTNLCIAYLKVGRLTEARTSCDTAVQEIETMLESRAITRSQYPVSQRKRRAFLAIALTNRGVVQAIDGKDSLAEADFLAAIEVRARLDQPETNLAHFTQMAALGE